MYIENGPLIGTYDATYSNYGGTADVAFIELDSDEDIYRTLYLGTTTIYGGYQNLLSGASVYKNGAITRITSGTVKNTSYSMTKDNVDFSDLVRADYSSLDGDSGAIVYSEPSAANTAFAVGVHKGKIHSYSTADTVYTKACNALDVLGAEIY